MSFFSEIGSDKKKRERMRKRKREGERYRERRKEGEKALKEK